MTFTILADSDIPYVRDYFSGLGELHLKPGRLIRAADVKAVDYLLVRSVTKVNAALLQSSRVRWVGSVTTGHDHLDTAFLEEAGIAWDTAFGFNAPPVADYVIAVLAALQETRHLKIAPLKIAVIGVGRIGSLVRERLKLLGHTVFLCDPLRARNEPDFPHRPFESLADLDMMSVHVPLHSPPYATHHLLDAAFMARQNAHCVLLNTSRGDVLNPAACLAQGRHLTVALDVWPNEPHLDLALLQQAAIATPHIAGYSLESKQRGIKKIYDAFIRRAEITARAAPLFDVHKKILSYPHASPTWRRIVLDVWDPLLATLQMKEALLHQPASVSFDDLRKHTHRHEYSSICVKDATLSTEETHILQGLGFTLSSPGSCYPEKQPVQY